MPAPLRWAGLVLAWLVVLTMSAALLVALVVPRLAGATPYVIETGSMTPNMPAGTLVVVKPGSVDDIAVGDVVTYQLRSGDPTVVTHRVVEQGFDMTGEPRWRTQGDANNAPDAEWVRPVQVKGVEWYAVPYLGYATSFVTEQQRGVLTTLLAVGLIGYAAVMFGQAALGRARKPAEDAPAAAAPELRPDDEAVGVRA
ncbi:signal peptidase I [Nocardioides sp. MAH-18]|uniref:Signal peptidase I n=2 Tax=Nocardioidaceae TaxID=85015 RepID=A0A6L6XL33_9ACTN|nr:signal peptidase I [Nocardioides sp. MAH-18]MBA2953069.1 signal peptidase I [Nocardioides sp. CGMCC 1.13656]MVQ47939.1 signal peptidase I [Nocardioides sp. MAH-18]